MMSDTSLADHIRHLLKPLSPIPTGYPLKLVKLRNIRVVVFDTYGTLLVSAAGGAGVNAAKNNSEAFRLALKDAGLKSEFSHSTDHGTVFEEEISASHQKSRYQGVDHPEVEIVEIWRRILNRLQDRKPDKTRFSHQQLRLLALSYECRVNPVWPMPNLVKTLTDLSRRGFRLGIISNAQFYTELLLNELTGSKIQHLGFDPDLCLWSYLQGKAKPSLDLFHLLNHKLEEKYSIQPHQILYVGNDMLKDIWPAFTIGWRTALFSGDRRSFRLRHEDKHCRNVEPDLVIDDLALLNEQLLPSDPLTVSPFLPKGT